MHNQSMPQESVVPVLPYPDVVEATRWLTTAFRFPLRWIVEDHRSQLAVGEGAVVVIEGPVTDGLGHVMVRVADVESHRRAALVEGATASDVADFPYGERQYTARDPWGRSWVFTQSVADVEPTDWGASHALPQRPPHDSR